MKPRIIEAPRRSRNLQGQGPNWILVAGGALLSTLSIRLGYKLKQVLDTKQQNNSSQSLKVNGKLVDQKKSGSCHLHSEAFSFPQDEDGCYNRYAVFQFSNQAESRQSLWTKKMNYFEWLLSLIIILTGPSFTHGSVIGGKVLHVGEELFKETLPLQNGACLYQLQGLKPQMWYEVKISYPASIPSSFSLQLERGTPDLRLNQGRKLLNTEKLIFKTDGIHSLSDNARMSVLVSVEPEGVVAIPGKREQEYAIYNIVCDELLLGIPHKAWCVVVMVLFCLVLAFAVPSFLPPFLLRKNGNTPTISKES